MIPGDLLSACPFRQFHTLPGLLDSRIALPNSYPNASRAIQGGSLYYFMMVFCMTRPGGELTTYRVRGGHANHLANPTRFVILKKCYNEILPVFNTGKKLIMKYACTTLKSMCVSIIGSKSKLWNDPI